MAAELASVIEEFDINPVIESPHGCVAVDALVIGRMKLQAWIGAEFVGYGLLRECRKNFAFLNLILPLNYY